MIVEISVSFLSIDYEDKSAIDQAIMRISNANYLHFDVMDGKLVKAKTYGAEMVEQVRTSLHKEVHLMVKSPEKYIDKMAKAGASTIIFHSEATRSPRKLIEKIKAKGIHAGIALSPDTPISKIDKLLGDVDLVLVMTVKPGKPGQKFIASTLKKIKALRKKKPMLSIAVDGGINMDTAAKAIEAGANILVSGSYIFSSKDPKTAIDLLRNA